MKTLLKALIIDGQNNHDWRRSTPILRRILNHAGFSVEVATTPSMGASLEKWESFRPAFDRYHVVVSNYSGDDWPTAKADALEEWVAKGGGYVVVHAGGTSHPNRISYNRLVGLAWRSADQGDWISVDADGNVVRIASGQGLATGHGPCFAYPINHHQMDHPILRGLPPIWLHTKDELWHAMRGPAENLTVLASAFSPRTGRREPVMWTVAYGKGRSFVTALGHVWRGGDTSAVDCIGFRDTLARGCQWAATGDVDLPVPENFPAEGSISTGDPDY